MMETSNREITGAIMSQSAKKRPRIEKDVCVAQYHLPSKFLKVFHREASDVMDEIVKAEKQLDEAILYHEESGERITILKDEISPRVSFAHPEDNLV